MPEYLSDILFILVLVGAWVAQQVLRRRSAARRARAPQVSSPPATETASGRVQADKRTPGGREADSAAPTRERRREGTVAPEEAAARPEAPPRLIAGLELSPRTMRQAIILTEVLGKPRSLR